MTKTTKIILWLVVAILVVGAVYYSLVHKRVPASISGPLGPGDICTMDAKQCPDGSWVGRTGPNCDFVCPNVPIYNAVVDENGTLMAAPVKTGK